jgi:KaiC/GvpD/RAD55 family RecA-like ATPase
MPQATVQKPLLEEGKKARLHVALSSKAGKYGEMLRVIPRISAFTVNNTIRMHPTFTCDAMCMFLDMAMGEKQPFVPYLVGNPGTGKTFAAEMLLDVALTKMKGVFSSQEGTEKGLKDALAKCMDAGMLESDFRPEKSKTFVEYFKKSDALAEIASAMADAYTYRGKDSKPLPAAKKEQIKGRFEEMMVSLKAIANSSGKPREEIAKELDRGISTDVYVLPSASSATDIISEEAYVISSSGIERMVKHPIIRMLAEAYEGKISTLIIDEASETLKEKAAARVKNLHPLIDAQVNGKALLVPINPENVDDEGREMLMRLKSAVEKRMKEGGLWAEDNMDGMKALSMDIGAALEGRRVQLSIPMPDKSCIIMTGNVRQEYEQIGLTPATWRRIRPIMFSYLPPEHMEKFLNDLKDRYRDELRTAMGSEFNSIESDMGEKRDEFVRRLVDIYRGMHSSYMGEPAKFANRMLPSLRSMAYALRSFESYYAMSSIIRGSSDFDSLDCSEISLSLSSHGGQTYVELKKDKKGLKGILPTQQRYGEFLLASMELSTYIPVGSFTETSESRSGESEMTLRAKAREIFAARGLKGGSAQERMVSIRLGKKEYVYSEPNFMYVMYGLANSLSRQRLMLLVGESQEGKTTTVDFTQAFLREKGRSFGFDEVRYVGIDDIEEFTLRDPNIKRREKEGAERAVKKSLLRETVEEASENQETTFIVRVDEVDNLRFSQELNALFTRDRITIGGKAYNIGNMVIMGTSNISRVMLDNFVSRGGIPLVFTGSISKVEQPGQNFDIRNIYLMHAAIERALGSAEKANETMGHVLSDANTVSLISRIDFYEIAKTQGKLATKYMAAVEKGMPAEDYAGAVSAYIRSIIQTDVEREQVKRGAV